ncbi:MAG TPA: 3-isopropylmalate dehydrogenase, partial [Gammaproteobacteria bacterium]|nr:3-isopropylmalate dehydrogenase [Gammaproteobacteria bacterium]
MGPEIIAEAAKILEYFRKESGLDATLEYGLLGVGAVDELGEPYPEATRRQAREADAILLGAVGGPKWEAIDRPLRPERGLLAIRSDLELFANLRPALLYPQLASASALKPEIVAGLDILIVRELNGGIYFGQPRG